MKVFLLEPPMVAEGCKLTPSAPSQLGFVSKFPPHTTKEAAKELQFHQPAKT